MHETKTKERLTLTACIRHAVFYSDSCNILHVAVGGTVQLICTFSFHYAKSKFSHDVSQIYCYFQAETATKSS